MQYGLQVFGYNYGTKVHLANAYFDYERQEPYLQIVEKKPYSHYRTASRKMFDISQMYLRAQNAVKRIATKDPVKYEFRYIYDTATYSETRPVACIALDNETGWFGASFVNPTPVYRTETREIVTPKGTVLRQHTIDERDVFQYTVARERAIENIGRLLIPNRLVGIGTRKEKLSVIINHIMSDWDLA